MYTIDNTYTCICFPLQTAFYFPLHKRLRALMRIKEFRDLLDHEYDRPRATNPNLLSDVYDGSAWKNFMGPPQKPCKRIGLVGCSDGFQAFTSGTLSLTPLVLSIFSLPPALRFKNEYMLLHMLLPTDVKGMGLKKYYDFAARYELNFLYHKGFFLQQQGLICFVTHRPHYYPRPPSTSHTPSPPRSRWSQSQSFQLLNGYDRSPRTSRHVRGNWI